jgi:parallel beta-helix repeat protein
MNRAVFASLTILCLLSVSSITGLIQVVKADVGTIYIRADGSITPSSAPITTVDNTTYTFTGNVNESIVVERDNIVIDGAGQTLQGSGNGIGLTERVNVTIKGAKIGGFDSGVYLCNASFCGIYGNNITNNNQGIWLYSSSNYNSISGNNITNRWDGIGLNSSSGNSISGNNITANNELGIRLDSTSGNTLSGNNVTANNNYGILLNYSSNNVLSGNNVTNSEYGIELSVSSNNFILHNNFVDNTNQVYTEFSANIWDDGNRGNYWSDYLTKYPNAAQVDSSGVWNTPYVIDTNNTDHYPLMVPIVIPEFPSIQATMFFMLLTLLTVIIYKKKGVKTSQS